MKIHLFLNIRKCSEKNPHPHHPCCYRHDCHCHVIQIYQKGSERHQLLKLTCAVVWCWSRGCWYYVSTSSRLRMPGVCPASAVPASTPPISQWWDCWNGNLQAFWPSQSGPLLTVIVTTLTGATRWDSVKVPSKMVKIWKCWQFWSRWWKMRRIMTTRARHRSELAQERRKYYSLMPMWRKQYLSFQWIIKNSSKNQQYMRR